MNIHYKSRGKHDVPGTAFLSMHINPVEADEGWVKTEYVVWTRSKIIHYKNTPISLTALRRNYIEIDKKADIIKDIFYRS